MRLTPLDRGAQPCLRNNRNAAAARTKSSPTTYGAEGNVF